MKTRNLTKQLRKKLNSQSGETIAETLVALLIASLAMVMLASMINTTVNLVTKSKTKMEDYYKQSVKLEDTSAFDQQIKISIQSGSDSEGSSGQAAIQEEAKYQINATFSMPVVAYSYTKEAG